MLRLGLLLVLLPGSFVAHAATTAEPKPRVAILLFDGVEIIDFAAPYEVFGQAGFDVRTVSHDGKPVTTSMKLKVEVDEAFDAARDADIVVIPGGDVDEAAHDADTRAWLRRMAAPAKQVMSVCTGSDILAGTGLLDGQSATTFHQHFDHMAKAYPAVQVARDQRWVQAGKFVTAAGLASGMDAALHVVANLRGLKAARSVAMHLEYDWSPEHGFVRGMMADQYLRMPVRPLAFPEGTQVHDVSSLGDTKHWETEYRVESSLSPEAFIAHVRELATDDKALRILPLPDPLQVAWEYTAERGGQWRLNFKAGAREPDGGYPVTVKIMRLH